MTSCGTRGMCPCVGMQASRKVSTHLSIGADALEETVDPVNLLEDGQTLPSLTSVVWLLLVVALEEQSRCTGWQRLAF